MCFGLLEIQEWFIVPESKRAFDPSELFSMLRDDIFWYLNINRFGKAKIERTDDNVHIKAPVEYCANVL